MNNGQLANTQTPKTTLAQELFLAQCTKTKDEFNNDILKFPSVFRATSAQVDTMNLQNNVAFREERGSISISLKISSQICFVNPKYINAHAQKFIGIKISQDLDTVLINNTEMMKSRLVPLLSYIMVNEPQDRSGTTTIINDTFVAELPFAVENAESPVRPKLPETASKNNKDIIDFCREQMTGVYLIDMYRLPNPVVISDSQIHRFCTRGTGATHAHNGMVFPIDLKVKVEYTHSNYVEKHDMCFESTKTAKKFIREQAKVSHIISALSVATEDITKMFTEETIIMRDVIVFVTVKHPSMDKTHKSVENTVDVEDVAALLESSEKSRIDAQKSLKKIQAIADSEKQLAKKAEIAERAERAQEVEDTDNVKIYGGTNDVNEEVNGDLFDDAEEYNSIDKTVQDVLTHVLVTEGKVVDTVYIAAKMRDSLIDAVKTVPYSASVKLNVWLPMSDITVVEPLNHNAYTELYQLDETVHVAIRNNLEILPLLKEIHISSELLTEVHELDNVPYESEEREQQIEVGNYSKLRYLYKSDVVVGISYV